MTDLERFVTLYKDFGIDCIVNENNDEIFILLAKGSYKDEQETHSEKFDGYSSFYSRVAFSKEGKFISQGFWE